MNWLKVDAETHEVAEDNLSEKPDFATGYYSLRAPDGYPAAVEWSAEARGFRRVETIEDRRAAVRARRDRAEWGGCPTPLGVVDSDPDSQRKVSGAAQMALMAQAADQPFTIAWTMADNVDVPHDAPAMMAMGVAVGLHVAACHAVARAKIAAIDAGEAYDIEEGWPNAA